MIQRIQSLLLAAVAVLHIIAYYLPFWMVRHQGLGEVLTLTVGDVSTHGSSVSAGEPLEGWVMGLAIANGLITLLALITIFLYSNRMLQLRLTRIMLFLEVIFVFLMFYSTEKGKELVPATDEMSFQPGAFLPLLAIILIFFAGQRIRHDERLVRSADRLR